MRRIALYQGFYLKMLNRMIKRTQWMLNSVGSVDANAN